MASNPAINAAASSGESPNTLTADSVATPHVDARGAELVTPVVWSFTLLRVTAILAAISGLLGRVVVPGARGTLPEGTVVLLERASATASYALVGLITALLAAG